MTRILIVDDHPIVRKGLKQILGEAEDIIIADEADRGLEVLKKIKGHSYDLILLDLSLPDMSGIEVLRELKTKKVKIPVLVLSMYSEEQYAIKSFQAGAAGYITKESLPDELTGAIRLVKEGKKYITPSVAELMALNLEHDNRKLPHENLSGREFFIMCMIGSGKSIKHIADELSLSLKTISTYKTRMLKKMKMENNSDIIRYVIENKLA